MLMGADGMAPWALQGLWSIEAMAGALRCKAAAPRHLRALCTIPRPPPHRGNNSIPTSSPAASHRRSSSLGAAAAVARGSSSSSYTLKRLLGGRREAQLGLVASRC